MGKHISKNGVLFEISDKGILSRKSKDILLYIQNNGTLEKLSKLDNPPNFNNLEKQKSIDK